MPVPEWTGVQVPEGWWDKGIGRDLENFPREVIHATIRKLCFEEVCGLAGDGAR